MELVIERTLAPKKKPDGALGFGKLFTDHMFVMEYEGGEWKNARICPYGPITLDPSAAVFHYGQTAFEGMKAYKNRAGEIRLFRPEENMHRMNRSCKRICVPEIDEKFVLDALIKLILLDSDWIPTGEGEALYLRPTVIATEPALGVHAATSYVFFIIMSPSGAYYSHGFGDVKLFVEENYVRAARGGTGHYKIGGNYAASLLASEEAKAKGYDQVMWLDSKYHKFVEEVGSMNIFFAFGDRIITPALVGSILPGITRKSVIEYLRSVGVEVEEYEIGIDEIVEGAKSGKLTEIFGTGTAAVISPVGAFSYRGTEYKVCGGKVGKWANKIYDTLTGIQTGRLKDEFGWSRIINK